jgi:hypothetical protein
MSTATSTKTLAPAVQITPTVLVTLSQEQLIGELCQLKGAAFISLVYDAPPSKMRKTGNPYAGNCRKISNVNGMVNFNYDEGVLRRLEKEGKSPDDFKQGTSWHTPFLIDGRLTPICKHKTTNQPYLRFMFLKSVSCEYRTLDGTPIDEKKIQPFLPEKSGYENQGLSEENILIFLTYSLENIRQITFGGQTYQIRN